MVKMTFFVVTLLFALTTGKAFAVDVKATAIDTKDNALIALKAQQFNVTEDEWKKYLVIMDGEGQYHWNNVDPLVVLGIYAEDADERRRYARKVAEREYELQSMFIAFNRDYMQAFDDLYGDEKIIDLSSVPLFRDRENQSATHADNNSSVGDRYVLFVSTKCRSCEPYFQSLRSNQKIGTVIDVHFVGDSKKEIGQWAKRLNIRPQDVSNGSITLNIDSGMYASYQRPSLPAAFYFDQQTQSVEQLP
jgi:integrating conjugative element protein (TIGR03759 family)